MRRLLPTGLLLLAALSASAAAQGAEVRESETTLQWQLSLDEHGKVTALEFDGDGIAALRARLESMIRDWEFVPGTRNGAPQATKTQLSVQLGLTPNHDGSEFSVRIRDARTGGSIAKATAAPQFPRSMVSQALREDAFRALVVVEVRYDTKGEAVAVTAAQGSPVQDGPLLDAVRKALKRWTYQPEQITGVGMAGTVLVPVCFIVGRDSTKARQQSADCRWTQPGTQISVGEGSSLALDSSVQIKTGVRDRVL